MKEAIGLFIFLTVLITFIGIFEGAVLLLIGYSLKTSFLVYLGQMAAVGVIVLIIYLTDVYDNWRRKRYLNQNQKKR